MLSVTDLMEFPPPEEMQWGQWGIRLNLDEKRVINLIDGPIKEALQQKGIIVEIIIQPISTHEDPWGDYGIDILIDKYGYGILDCSYIISEFLLNRDTCMLEPFLRRGLYVKHNISGQRDSILVPKILHFYLGNYFFWDGNPKNCFVIQNKTIDCFI